MRMLNVDDFFVVSLDELKKNKDREDVDKENFLATINFFESNEIDHFKATLKADNDRIYFHQEFFDKNGVSLEINASFGDKILLHFDNVCEKKKSFYSNKKGSINSVFNVGNIQYRDGDLFFFPVSILEKRDVTLFSGKFNEQINNAIKNKMKNIVFSFHYQDDFRKKASDDFSDFFSGQKDEFGYSLLNPEISGRVDLFFTDDIGSYHLSLSDFSDRKQERKRNEHLIETSNLFYGNDINEDEHQHYLDNVSMLRENTLKTFASIPGFEKSLSYIGNFHSEENKFISAFHMRKHFKNYQQRNHYNLENIQCVLIKKEDLPKRYQDEMIKDENTMIIIPSINEKDDRLINVDIAYINVLDDKFKQSGNKRRIGIYELNTIIDESKSIDVKILKDHSTKERFPFEYDRYGRVERSLTKLYSHVEKANIYSVDVDTAISLLNNDAQKEQLSSLKSLGIKDVMVNFFTHHNFLMSDHELKDNGKIIIPTERFLEGRIYPVYGKNKKIVNLELLSLFDENELTEDNIKKLIQMNEKKKSVSFIHAKFIALQGIELETSASIDFIEKGASKMKVIEERKSPHFNKATVIDDYLGDVLSEIWELKISENKKNKIKL